LRWLAVAAGTEVRRQSPDVVGDRAAHLGERQDLGGRVPTRREGPLQQAGALAVVLGDQTAGSAGTAG